VLKKVDDFENSVLSSSLFTLVLNNLTTEFINLKEMPHLSVETFVQVSQDLILTKASINYFAFRALVKMMEGDDKYSGWMQKLLCDVAFYVCGDPNVRFFKLEMTDKQEEKQNPMEFDC